MLPRTLEPEVMDSLDEAVDYDSMDHAEVNRRFVDDLLSALQDLSPGLNAPHETSSLRIIDVGTGTAQIPVELGKRSRPPGARRLRITGVDLAASMLELGRCNVAEAGLVSVIQLDHVDAKGLPYPEASFDVVMSNSILHHIPEPLDALREMRRVLAPGGLLFVRDLLRPADETSVDRLVDLYAAGANDHQRGMFHASLHAALTVDEMQSLLQAVELPAQWVTQTSDRHWTIRGKIPGDETFRGTR